MIGKMKNAPKDFLRTKRNLCSLKSTIENATILGNLEGRLLRFLEYAFYCVHKYILLVYKIKLGPIYLKIKNCF